MYCAPQSLLHGQLVLTAFSSNGRWVPPMPVVKRRTLLGIKIPEMWCRIASEQCHTGSLVLPAGALLGPQDCGDSLPAGRPDRSTKQTLQTPTFIWVDTVIAGSRRYCPLLWWLSCAARAITGSSDCHWLGCLPLNLTADSLCWSRQLQVESKDVGYPRTYYVAVLVIPFSPLHATQSRQKKFPQQKVPVYNSVWAIQRLHQSCLWGFDFQGSWWDQQTCLLGEGLHHRTGPCHNRSYTLAQWWHPAQGTMQNTEASKYLLVWTRFRSHDMAVIYCAGFG